MPNLSEELRELKELRDRRDDAKAEYDTLNDDLRARKQAILRRYEQEGVQSQKSSGYNFVKATTVYGKVDDEEAFKAWAREEAPGLLEEKPREGLINETVRECLDDGRPLPPGLIDVPVDKLSIRVAS